MFFPCFFLNLLIRVDVPDFFFFNLTCFGKVLGESLRITTDYLNVEEKVMMATSKAKSVKAECS